MWDKWSTVLLPSCLKDWQSLASQCLHIIITSSTIFPPKRKPAPRGLIAQPWISSIHAQIIMTFELYMILNAYIPSGSDQRRSHMGPSWGTSCLRSMALIWSRVVMDGEMPPWTQKICRKRIDWIEAMIITLATPLHQLWQISSSSQKFQCNISTHSPSHISVCIRHKSRTPVSMNHWNEDPLKWGFRTVPNMGPHPPLPPFL